MESTAYKEGYEDGRHDLNGVNPYTSGLSDDEMHDWERGCRDGTSTWLYLQRQGSQSPVGRGQGGGFM